MLLNRRIKQVREFLKLTQVEFCEKIGIQQGFLSAIEREKSKPSVESLMGIARAFKINTHWLLTGEGKMYQVRDEWEEETMGTQIADPEEKYELKKSQEEWMDELINMTRMILMEKASRHSKSLEENIRSFFQAVCDEKDLRQLRDKGKKEEDNSTPNPLMEGKERTG